MLKLKIEVGNAAFHEDDEQKGDTAARDRECARILRRAADEIENGSDSLRLRDINGNLVGICTVTSR